MSSRSLIKPKQLRRIFIMFSPSPGHSTELHLRRHEYCLGGRFILMPWIGAVLVVHGFMRTTGRHAIFAVEGREILLPVLLHASVTQDLRVDFPERPFSPVRPMESHVERYTLGEAHIHFGIADSLLWRAP